MAQTGRAGAYKSFEDFELVEGRLNGLSYLQIQSNVPHRTVKSLERRFHKLRNSSRVEKIKHDLFLARGVV
jgi:hypothetical protein